MKCQRMHLERGCVQKGITVQQRAVYQFRLNQAIMCQEKVFPPHLNARKDLSLPFQVQLSVSPAQLDLSALMTSCKHQKSAKLVLLGHSSYNLASSARLDFGHQIGPFPMILSVCHVLKGRFAHKAGFTIPQLLTIALKESFAK